MQRIQLRPLAATAVLGLAVAGCAGLPAAQGLREIRSLIDAHDGRALTWPTETQTRTETDQAVNSLLRRPLSPDDAVQVAVLRNPRMQLEYARLGISRADVLDASRISNPAFSVSVLDPRAAATPSRIDAVVMQSFSDLLLLPARRRLAIGEYRRTQQLIATAILDLVTDVRAAWYGFVGAQQVAAMREAVAKAAQTSAELAAKFHEAGNISVLQLKLEQAAATQARLGATRARTDATRTRAALGQLLGLSGKDEPWATSDRLPAPVFREDSPEALLALAASQRLDLSAARNEVALREQALGVSRRYRWLGRVDVGVAGERDTDRARLVGPTLAIQLPLFDQGRGTIARGRALVDDSRARLQSLELSIDTAVRLGTERIRAARSVADDYRSALIPEREAVVARTQETVNYVFAGTFELLLAKQQEYDAYQGYFEAVRDYWLARVDLMHAVGARLPSDSAVEAPTDGGDETTAPPAAGTNSAARPPPPYELRSGGGAS
jgi:cobalt-zinc-cadmium efflux system outer membrane protein